MRDLLTSARPARLDPTSRRIVRWSTARWTVRLCGTTLGLVLVASTALSWRPATRSAVESEPPSLARIDAALALAEGYLDQLYRPLPDGRAVVSEYYGLPVRAYFPETDEWVRPGDARLTIVAGEVGRERESALFRYTFADRDPVDLLTVVRWDDTGAAHVEVTQVAGDRLPVQVWLDEQRLATWSAGETARSARMTLGADDRAPFRSLRYTVRHVAMMSELAYAYRDRPDRSAALASLVSTTGYDADSDVYASAWGRGVEQPDGFVFADSIYRDCTSTSVWDEMPDAPAYYPYQSKVCSIPTPGYVAMSREDPLVPSSAALHVLEKYGDAERHYSDGEHLNVTPVSLVADLERRYRRDGGIAECLPGACDTSATSVLRTAMFGMVETELGFALGDETSRSYADAVAAGVLDDQVGADGQVPTTTYGDLYRPVEAGGFFTHVTRQGRAGDPPTFVGTQLAKLAQALDIRSEYTGDVSTNAETTLVTYAFLLRYRCARYGVGCAGLAEQPAVR